MDREGRSGSILMGVCRGRLSEGIDFKDAMGRLVIIVGIPNPSRYERRIILKEEVLDRKIARQGTTYQNAIGETIRNISGHAWYNLLAYRAVNQAIGRVIRHKDDYGLITLIDDRYSKLDVRENISKWLQDVICGL